MNLKRKTTKEVLFLNKNREVPLLQFPKLTATGLVEHGFTTRVGGVSKNELSTLNLSYTRGDEEENVTTNFKRLAKALNREYEDITAVSQIHSTKVIKVTNKERGMGISRDRGVVQADGLITNEKGIVLSAYFADCVPIFLLDPVNKAIGMVHSGWRGTAYKISDNAIKMLDKEYGSKPKDIIAAIGPSICRECYEVSEDVKLEFEKGYSKDEVEAIFDNKGNGKYQLDLWMANRIVLKNAGIAEENIEVTDICTCCNSKVLFSHRASQGKRGNLGGFISLK